VAEDTRDDVRVPAGRIGHDEAQRALGVLRERRAYEYREQKGDRAISQHRGVSVRARMKDERGRMT